MYRYNDANYHALLTLHVRGAAWKAIEAKPSATAAGVIAALKERFAGAAETATLWGEVRKLKQGARPFIEYATQLQELLQAVSPDMAEKDVVSWFVQGMRADWARMAVGQGEDESIATLFAFARRQRPSLGQQRPKSMQCRQEG